MRFLPFPFNLQRYIIIRPLVYATNDSGYQNGSIVRDGEIRPKNMADVLVRESEKINEIVLNKYPNSK